MLQLSSIATILGHYDACAIVAGITSLPINPALFRHRHCFVWLDIHSEMIALFMGNFADLYVCFVDVPWDLVRLVSSSVIQYRRWDYADGHRLLPSITALRLISHLERHLPPSKTAFRHVLRAKVVPKFPLEDASRGMLRQQTVQAMLHKACVKDSRDN